MLPLSALEERIGYEFKDKKLLRRAITHRSFGAEHNERLEFLGDSVLNCVIGYTLFQRDQHFNEGDLSRVRANLVCEGTLYEIARRIDVSSFLLMGDGEVKTGGHQRPSILADAMEAIFGAVFRESGFETAERVILKLYEPIFSTGLPAEKLSKDPKTRLQELLQGEHLPRPEYSIVSTSGAAHERSFECECRIEALGIVTTGRAKNRRAAEQCAAEAAIEIAKQRTETK
ncbi:ribonuclease III [Sutterella sp.]|uniref:ribonuclease III n=1 Tax=Sutterella sp. TaxID=1981025 RepID=UPI0026DFFFA9|nr:ribonuclease III [Sutterella sp.]MDO5531096.1 ribonuclease III [Sutterella sp.]